MNGLRQWILRAVLTLFMLKLASVYGHKFVVKPENGTVAPGESVTLKCGVDSSSLAGMEWLFISANGSKTRIGEWVEGNSYNPPPPGFEVHRPDNFTSHLTVLNWNTSFAGEYCCQYNNALGQKSCATLTEATYSLSTGVDLDKVTTAYSLSTGVNLDKVTTALPSEEIPTDNSTDTSPAGNFGLLIGLLIAGIIIIVGLTLGIIWWKRKQSQQTPADNEHTGGQESFPLNSSEVTEKSVKPSHEPNAAGCNDQLGNKNLMQDTVLRDGLRKCVDSEL